MKIRWTQTAEKDREEIWNYMVEHNPLAAINMDTLFSEAVEQLVSFPWLGPVGQIPGTRELIPHESYRLVYEVVKDTVWILALVHTARQWPPMM